MSKLTVGQPVQIRYGSGLMPHDVPGVVTRISRRALAPVTVQWGHNHGQWDCYHEDELEPYVPEWEVGDTVRVLPSPVPESKVRHFAAVGETGWVEEDGSMEACTLVTFGPGSVVLDRVVEPGETLSQYVLNAELELVDDDDLLDDDDTEDELGNIERGINEATVVQLEPPMLDLIAEATARSLRADLGAGPDDRTPVEWAVNLGAAYGDIAACAAEFADNLVTGEYDDGVLEAMRADSIGLAADCLELVSAIDRQTEIDSRPVGLDPETEYARRNGPTHW